MNEDLSLTPAGANLVKHFEGCLQPHQGGKYKSYLCPAKVWTIGWGTTSEHGHPIKADTVWSKAQCDSAFLHDMEKFEAAVRRHVTIELEPWQFDALTSFTYNVGEGSLARSTLLKCVNRGDFGSWSEDRGGTGAAAEFPKWNKAGGKVMAGLVRRRASESLLFQNVTDLNYDGKADPGAGPAIGPMPQAIDPPKEE